MPNRLLVFLLALAAPLAAVAAETAPVEISDAWARATPGGAENGAAYLTLASPGGDRLNAVSSPAARTSELHTMTMDGGVMRMAPLAAIELPPGQKVTLRPGAMHIMLIGLRQPLRPGESVALTLRFEKAGTREVAAVVGRVGAMTPDAPARPGTHTPAPGAH